MINNIVKKQDIKNTYKDKVWHSEMERIAAEADEVQVRLEAQEREALRHSPLAMYALEVELAQVCDAADNIEHNSHVLVPDPSHTFNLARVPTPLSSRPHSALVLTQLSSPLSSYLPDHACTPPH